MQKKRNNVSTQLKDIFFTKKSISDLANHTKKVCPEFERDKFYKLVFDSEWDKRELKDKMHHVTYCLHESLPLDYKKSISILKKVVPNITGFDGMVFPDFVEQYGLDDFKTSLEALIYFTKHFSSEFAIRPFIIKNRTEVMNLLLKCAEDKNEHVRRFASEGCRPRLPWAMALPEFKKDPSPILPILEKLKNDKSEFVRKSVANNLNDISKDNPKIALKIFNEWYGKSERTDWIVKHASRTLLKAGNNEAMKIFGYSDHNEVEIKNFRLTDDKIKMGDELKFSFQILVKSKKKSSVRIEYLMQFTRANNKSGEKVFKITESIYEPGLYAFDRKHSFKKISTRKYYPGKHKITLIINGERKKSISFDLS